jgi:hypothetical protein
MRWFSFSEQQETKDISFWRRRLSQLYLVFLIMLLVGNETLACGMPRLPRVTEFSAPGLAIDISIIDSAEDVDLPYHPPIGRRLVILIFGVLGGFLCCIAGIQQFDRNRRMIGVALVAFGLGGCAVGLGLWWATFSFSDTWGWFV